MAVIVVRYRLQRSQREKRMQILIDQKRIEIAQDFHFVFYVLHCFIRPV